jgi:hypothetical protein
MEANRMIDSTVVGPREHRRTWAAVVVTALVLLMSSTHALPVVPLLLSTAVFLAPLRRLAWVRWAVVGFGWLLVAVQIVPLLVS